MGDVDYLMEPEGSQLHWDGIKPNRTASSTPDASLSGPSAVRRRGMSGSIAERPIASPQPSPAQERALTHAELLRMANEMLARQASQNSASLADGPSVTDREAAPKWLTKYMGDDIDSKVSER